MENQKDCFVTSRKFRIIYWLLHFYHLFLTRSFFLKIKCNFRQAPQKILLANWGALGDVVLSSGVIAEIRTKFPNCKIGFLVSKKSRVVLETCPSVDWIHEVHSWFVPGQPLWKNFLYYAKFVFTEQPKLANELAQIKYDAAIELRPFIPNIIPLFWRARIPIRVGFSSGGNSGLLNFPVEWNCQEYLPYCYPSLLEKFEISLTNREQILPKISPKKEAPLLVSKPYLLFHLCSSDDRKELPAEFWNSLKLKCQCAGYTVYFTGMGNREKGIIDRVSNNSTFNLCNRLDWDQLVQHIQHAQGIVSVDSVPVHLAAAFDVPCAVIFRSTNHSNLWNPNRSTTHSFQFIDNNLIEPIFDVIKQWMSTYKRP